MCECFAYIYVCGLHVRLVPVEVSTRTLYPLELDLQMTVSHHVDAGY